MMGFMMSWGVLVLLHESISIVTTATVVFLS